LSQQIIKLEREIGTKLFIRHPRRVELTEAGMIFRERAQRVLDDASDALEHVKMAARGESGNLSIGFAGSTVFHPTVARLLRRFREEYPGVKIRTEESNSVALLGKLARRAGRLRDGAPAARLRRLEGDAAGAGKMIAVLPSGHALGRRRSIDLKQLAGDPFILYPRAINPELHDAIISACRTAGFSPRIEMESPQISSGVNMAAAGFGVAIIPESIAQFRAEGVTYQNISNKDLGTAIALITRPRDKSVTVKNFTELVRQFHRR
jgi:DNA-binding transcriptional LysR family regulator